MATLTLRQTNPATGTNKGAPLTNAEVDANFNSLDTAKLEKSGGTMTGTITLTTGTTTVAPLKLVAGTNLTTPAAGALEFDGASLFFTPAGSRKTVAFTDSNITGSAASWSSSRTITLAGDLSGSVSIDGTANVTLTATVAANSVALGTDTTGDYVTSLVAGTGVSLLNNSGEGATPTVSIGQAVATSDAVQFARIGVGMTPSGTAGRIDALNDVVAFSTSDARMKKNVANISNALEKVLSLNGVTFTWDETMKEHHGYEGRDTGVIAQDVEKVLPEVVQVRENGYMAVKYEKMIGLLVEAIKEMNEKLEKCNCN